MISGHPQEAVQPEVGRRHAGREGEQKLTGRAREHELTGLISPRRRERVSLLSGVVLWRPDVDLEFGQEGGRRKAGNAQSHKFARTDVRPAVAEPTEVVLSFPSTAGVRLATCAGRFDFARD